MDPFYYYGEDYKWKMIMVWIIMEMDYWQNYYGIIGITMIQVK